MQKTWRSHLLVSYALAVLAFLYLPILILALYSFNDSRMNAVWAGFTFNGTPSFLITAMWRRRSPIHLSSDSFPRRCPPFSARPRRSPFTNTVINIGES